MNRKIAEELMNEFDSFYTTINNITEISMRMELDEAKIVRSIFGEAMMRIQFDVVQPLIIKTYPDLHRKADHDLDTL